MYTIKVVTPDKNNTFSPETYYLVVCESGKTLCKTDNYMDANFIARAVNQYTVNCSKGV
jgi:hypothetical protein